MRRALGLLVVFLSCVPPRQPAAPASTVAAFPAVWPHPTAPEARSPRGMIASDAALGSEVGRAILARGGNAVDAAVATALALAVVYPQAGNLGGGGFLVARVQGQAYALDFREKAPAKATSTMFARAEDAATGHRSAGVPGSVAGLYEVHRRLGKKPWSELVAPAIRLADEGFLINSELATVLQQAKPLLERSVESAALYLPHAIPLAEGTRLRNPALAAVLRRLSDQGPTGFYQGVTADLLVNDMMAHNGLLTHEDLKSYEAKWRPPLSFTYRGLTVLSMPPPSSGGVTLAMMLHILEGYELRPLGWHSAVHVHLLAETMRRAYAARNRTLGDPDFVSNPLQELLSPTWATKARSTIRLDRSTPSTDLASSPEGEHTTHLSAVDADGNVVALTTTVNAWFGSGITVPGAGFLLNNEMDDFAARPGQPNAFGLVQGTSNAIAPGKRMLSSMTPTLVLDGSGHLVMALGAAGGPTITTAVLQILSNRVDFGFGLGQAVAAPRLHHQQFPDAVIVEASGFETWQIEGLKGRGHKVVERDHLADAPSIGVEGPVFLGAADVRRSGGLAIGP